MSDKRTILIAHRFQNLLVLSAFFLLIGNTLKSQNIELGNPKIALNEAFTISISAEEEEITYDAFPEIPGLEAQGVSRATSTRTVENKRKTTTTITKSYYPTEEGRFTLPSFKMKINETIIESKGLLITVGPYDDSKPPLTRVRYEDLLEKETLVELKDDAFLGLTVSKNAIYVGEGVTVSLALYVARNTNQVNMAFYNTAQQVESISQKLKPANCWEENFEISEVQEASISINNAPYEQYKIYEATFFPFNTEDIILPSVELSMSLYDKSVDSLSDAKNPPLKTFYSNPRKIRVKELPPHPLRDQVAVGVFYLQEETPSDIIKTGQNFPYNFIIVGEGNIAAIPSPNFRESNELIFYPPDIQQYINRGQGKVTGTKIFAFQGTAREAGKYELAKAIDWIFFNLNTERYDTLRSQKTLEVSGKSLRNAEIANIKKQAYYRNLNEMNNRLQSPQGYSLLKILAEIFLAILFVTVILVIYRYRA